MAEPMRPGASARAATVAVQTAQAAFMPGLPAEDGADFADAARGFIATLPEAEVRSARGRVVWSQAPYAFLDGDGPPAEINPSLWRQARLNRIHGLFEVVPGVYQVRGFDLANMTLVEGERGVIVVDALTATEVAAAALALYRAHRGERPVTGAIYTHTHSDHWGGMPAVVDAAAVRAGAVPLIAPDGFMHHAVAENVIAGPAMLRRSHYQFGPLLHKGPRGHIDNGLGKDMAIGGRGLIAPNDSIVRTGERRVIDGVEFIFQLAPDTEAPAEMHFYLPRQRVLNLAENATRTFHNLLPFRGAQARNSLDWSKYIHEALTLWGGEAEALAGQHHWPVWGNGRVRAHLEVQRDLYRFVHDQTVRLMNLGHTPQEIAERIELPPALAGAWHARGYYGSLRHNAKAIYQHYLGWYDANPAHLDPHEPAETGRRMVEYMGGAGALLGRARADFERGEFRWVVQVLNHLVFAEPGNAEGRALLADAYEQLGYLAEAATWRNAYLFAAQELRHGIPVVPGRSALPADTLRALSVGQMIDLIGVRLDPARAAGRRLVLNLRFEDGAAHVLGLGNGVVFDTPDAADPGADGTVTLARETLAEVLAGDLPASEAAARMGGDAALLLELIAMTDIPPRGFAIVEP